MLVLMSCLQLKQISQHFFLQIKKTDCAYNYGFLKPFARKLSFQNFIFHNLLLNLT